jgi:3'-phosphoadenosine 5'-phosphosulfate sulfotransferase (PAPS reductase)/FAD synthetase
VRGARVRHILGLSGGKDSAALAIYMRDRLAELEYFFCDTGHELPEVYEYLNRLEAYLGQRIVWLTNGGRDFEHYLTIYRNFLPSAQARWCTKHLKLEPLERYVGDDEVFSYVAIRADEEREGYQSTKPNIKSVFPFVDNGFTERDVLHLLESSGLGLPEYYKWRTRSGCYFCFFQRKMDWVMLLEKHPELFDRAKRYEKSDPETGELYTWSQGESLNELSKPERVAQIKAEHAEALLAYARVSVPNRPLIRILSDDGLI